MIPSPTSSDDQVFTLRGSAERRPTVLVFLSPWCESYLASSRPKMSADCRAARLVVSGLAGSNQLRWLGIASGLWANADDVTDYQKKYDVGIPLAVDESGVLFRSFGVTTTPTIVVADANGVIVRRVEAGQEVELAQALKSL